MCTSCTRGLPECSVLGCDVRITATTWNHSNGHEPVDPASTPIPNVSSGDDVNWVLKQPLALCIDDRTKKLHPAHLLHRVDDVCNNCGLKFAIRWTGDGKQGAWWPVHEEPPVPTADTVCCISWPFCVHQSALNQAAKKLCEVYTGGCDDPACQEDHACCGKTETKGGEKTMSKKEKMIAAFEAFQDLLKTMSLVEVEKEGDEETLRFGLADEYGEVRAVILSDSSKYTGLALGESQAGE